MLCSLCQAPLTTGHVCASLARLPSIVALPLQEYAAEAQPVLRLHRLCDAAEILTRFCAIIALGEARACHAGTLPAELLRELQQHIERPTFGQWFSLLRRLVESLDRGQPLVVPELPGFVRRHLQPLAPGGEANEWQSLVALRNDRAHGGPLTPTAAEELLQDWQPRLRELVGRLAFLEDVEVCRYAGGRAHHLVGPNHLPGDERPLPADLRQALDARSHDGPVVLLRHERWLDLWPLCDHGRAVTLTPQGQRTARADSPLVYFRAEPRRLRYSALGSDRPYGERPIEVMDEFRRLFQLAERAPAADQPADFEQDMRNDADQLVGRRADLARLLDVILPAQRGVFWVGGPGGIGKSYLLAALCQSEKLCGDPKKVCLIAWRFKTSDQARGNRTAFFRHAVTRLAEWLQRPDVVPGGDTNELFGQLVRLLSDMGQLTPSSSHPAARAPRVLFVLDGLDEIARLDPSFVRLPLELQRPNVVWLCAGRPECELPRLYAPEACTHVFAGGLPAMSADDIRSMLLAETGRLKYDLLRFDVAGEPGASATGARNPAVEAVVSRAEGLPLYVRLVVEDVVSGQFSWEQLEQKLPRGLTAYYNELLNRWGLGALRTLLTPLVATIAWAKEPLEEETLFWLLVRSGVLLKADEARRALLRQGLDAVQGLLRPAAAPGGVGYEPYHPTFGEHLRADSAGVIGQENERAMEALLSLAREWSNVPAGHPARRYALRWGPRHLLDAGRAEDAAALLLDRHFLEAKTGAGLVFDLAGDFAMVVEALQEGKQRRTLELLEEALRRDIHFIQRHPATLFQCLWNSCWWYDCEEAAAHYAEGRSPGQEVGISLHRLLEEWRTAKDRLTPSFVWLRSLRPPALHLGGAQKMVFRGHEDHVQCLVAIRQHIVELFASTHR